MGIPDVVEVDSGGDIPALVHEPTGDRLLAEHGTSGFIGSIFGYDPLINFWAAHGVVVIRPNHLSANCVGLRETSDPDVPLYLRECAHDVVRVLDYLPEIKETVPGL